MIRTRHHIDLGRSFWLWASLGAIAACAAGALYAFYLQQAGEWARGFPWEIQLLNKLHVHLPTPIDWAMLALPWVGTNITIIPGVVIASWFLWRRGRKDLVVTLIVAT